MRLLTLVLWTWSVTEWRYSCVGTWTIIHRRWGSGRNNRIAVRMNRACYLSGGTWNWFTILRRCFVLISWTNMNGHCTRPRLCRSRQIHFCATHPIIIVKEILSVWTPTSVYRFVCRGRAHITIHFYTHIVCENETKVVACATRINAARIVRTQLF